MREIKFRFYSKNDKDKFFVIESSLEQIEDQDSWQGSSSWVRIATCQYTGLKDKNGKEIYEGDIITDAYHYDDNGNNLLGTVSFGECTIGGDEYYAFGFYLETKGVDYTDLITPHQARDSEVVGNIYQNPELMVDKLDNI